LHVKVDTTIAITKIAAGEFDLSIDFYDFFSGCGGTSQGMKDAGLTVRLGVDWDPHAEETYKANFKKANFVRSDIRKLKVEDVDPIIRRRYNRPLLFGACAPCQPFSKQNRTTNGEDPRRDLLGEFHRFVRAYEPEYLFIENVPGLQAIQDKEGPFSDFLRLLKKLKYWYAYKVVMAYHYGVPQSRRRLVLVASNLGPIEFPAATTGPGSKNPSIPTVWAAISHLPRIKAGQTHATIPNHRAANLSAINLKRIAATPRGGGRVDWPSHLTLDCHEGFSGHTDVYGRLAKNLPASALTTRCISLSNGRFGHPTQNRAISIREAACLQTFPMEFKFYGNLNSMAGQIGNAVPVEMARIFGAAILKHYKQHKSKKVR
jgi:DNA (cytosine-5)-methyltransferase 1